MSTSDPKSSAINLQQAISLATQHFGAGRLGQAQEICNRVLREQPNCGQAWHLLGQIAQQRGNLAAATDLFRRAVKANPNEPNYYGSLGIVLMNSTQFDEAIAAFRKLLELKPEFAPAYNNLGIALNANGQPEQAAGEFRRALAIKPDYAQAHHNLGNILFSTGQQEQAMATYRTALKIKPDYADAHQSLGIALFSLKRYEEAIEESREALRLKPDYAEASVNLGNSLRQIGRVQEAIDEYQRAVKLKPHDADAHHMLGAALQAQGDSPAALQSYQRALELKPDFADVRNSLGNLFWQHNRIDEAIAEFRLAIELKPEFPEAYGNLAIALIDQGDIAAAIAAYRTALQLKPHLHDVHSNLIFAMHFDPTATAQEIYQEEQHWNELHAAPLKKFIQPHSNPNLHRDDPERRLKIGYVSEDFRQHVVSWNLLPLFSEHNHDQYEIFCYSATKRPDELTKRIQGLADVWRNIAGIDDQRAAQMIREDKIDILIDLALHTADNRLLIFAYKSAPVQVTWLGYPGSTGLKTIDYRLSDPYIDPPETDLSVYSEQTVRLPNSFWCYEPGGQTPEPAAPPVLEAGHITFGCLNNFAKVSSAALDLWMQILLRLPGARLILNSKPGLHREKVRERFIHYGITADQIEFVGFQPWEQYLKTVARIDIALDPFPYNGGITTCDNLWMGVPVVTLRGRTAVGRSGTSILSNIGLGDLVAQTPEEYMDTAVKLANDLPRLKELRATLRQRMENSPLMDAKGFARDIEAAYREMWRAAVNRSENR